MEKEYQTMINELIVIFNDSLSKEDINLLSPLFVDNLNELYFSIYEKNKKNGLKNSFLFNMMLQHTKKLANASLEEKKSYLIKDENFEKLSNLSNQIFEMAVSLLKEGKNGITVEAYKAYIEELNNSLDKVLP